jgi:hypothetical protein
MSGFRYQNLSKREMIKQTGSAGAYPPDSYQNLIIEGIVSSPLTTDYMQETSGIGEYRQRFISPDLQIVL